MRDLLERVKSYSIINNKKRILKNYYSKQIRKGKTYRASLLDRTVLIFIIYILFLSVLYIKTDKFLLSFFMSTITIYFLLASFSKLFKKIKIKKIENIKGNLKKERFLKELDNLNNEEFKNFIKELFKKYYKLETINENPPFDFKCKIEDDEYKVKCLKIGVEDKVSLRDINSFLVELNKINSNEGIVVTDSFFIEDLKENVDIIAYDRDWILDISKKVGLYPKDREIEEYIIDDFLENRSKIRERIKTVDKNKIIKLYAISIIFFFFSYLVGYRSYYKIMALSSLIIAIILSAYKFSEYIIIKDRSPFV